MDDAVAAADDPDQHNAEPEHLSVPGFRPHPVDVGALRVDDLPFHLAPVRGLILGHLDDAVACARGDLFVRCQDIG
jgi:hypothetical protein